MSGSYNIKPVPFGQKYFLLHHIKSGGMAAVWLGKMPLLDGGERLVAIKRILPHVAEDADFISMFIDEAKITAQLNHPNICKIYELGQDLEARSYYIVMEYVHGRDLRALFDLCVQNATPPPIPVSCYIMACCCDGLNHAHRLKNAQGEEMDIVHRDVSLQNILVSFEGDVKIIDFGIAKAAGKSTKTAPGTLKGKFSYMSPEQISCKPEDVDRRSDVFGIGICLYELLTGTRLFSGKTDFSVLEKVRKAEVPLPSTINKDIPPELERIVLKALARSVEERYQYASEVGDDLWHFLYSFEAVFERHNLANYMKTLFAQAYEEEKKSLDACVLTSEPVVPGKLAPQGAAPAELVDRTVLVETAFPPELEAAKASSALLLTEQYDVVASEPDEEEGMPSAPPSPPWPLMETPRERERHAATPPALSSDEATNASDVLRTDKTKPPTWKKYLWVCLAPLVLVALAAVVVLLWPKPMGNILIEVPPALTQSPLQLSINGKEMLDKNGEPIQQWPRLFRVPAGKVRIAMAAEGQALQAQEVVVPAGKSYARFRWAQEPTSPQEEAPSTVE